MSAPQQGQAFRLYKTIGQTNLWQVKGSGVESPFSYEAGIIIDFDGAPDAYAPRGGNLVGRDLLGNAVAVPDNQGRSPWLVPPRKKTDPATNPRWTPTYASTVRDPHTGASIQQAQGLNRGFYFSESSLKDYWHATPGRAQTDVAYQTNADVYPYLALPGELLRDSRLRVGDYALAIHGQTGLYTFAVYGDAKNKPVMGEASSALASALHVPSTRTGGTPNGVIYVVFPNTGLGPKSRCDLKDLDSNARRWLTLYNSRLNLVAEVTSCFSPTYPGVAQAFTAMQL